MTSIRLHTLANTSVHERNADDATALQWPLSLQTCRYKLVSSRSTMPTWISQLRAVGTMASVAVCYINQSSRKYPLGVVELGSSPLLVAT